MNENATGDMQQSAGVMSSESSAVATLSINITSNTSLPMEITLTVTSNVTDNASLYQDYNRGVSVEKTWQEWLIFAFTTGLFLTVSTWMAVALTKEYLFPLDGKKKKSRFAEWIQISSTLCTITTAVSFVVDFIEEIVVDYYAHELCRGIKLTNVILRFAAIYFSYLVFWLRQRSLYNQPGLRHLISPPLRVLSWISLLVSLAFPFVNCCIYLSAYAFAVTPSGCTVVGSTIPANVSWIVSAAGSVVTHASLLCAFVRPLMKHEAAKDVRGVDLTPVIVRSLVCASICAVSDVVAFTVCAIYIKKLGVAIGISVGGTITINMLMTVVAFPRWRETVFPFCRCDAKEEDADVKVVHLSYQSSRQL